jgi:dihydrolipoamide dehydrogenase
MASRRAFCTGVCTRGIVHSLFLFFPYEEHMVESQFDIAVVGGGPGGYTAAIRAAQLGLKTVVVEKEKLGGVCLNWGCIPTKALLKSAEFIVQAKRAADFGVILGQVNVDFPKIISRSRDVSAKVVKGVEYLMKKNAIEVIQGTAQLLGKGIIEITRQGSPQTQISAKHIILATGARPRSLPSVQFDGQQIISSTEAMTLQKLPVSMAIIGAGAIGVEFAYFYNALGTKVTLIEMMPTILPVEDREITKSLTSSLQKSGITILTEARVEKVVKGQKIMLTVSTKDGSKDLQADIALMAVGVQGNTENLGLEALGVKTDRGFIVVEKPSYKTSVENIYAIGDVNGPPWLAHVASAEGITCVESIAGKNPPAIDYDTIPGCTYCQPQVASVGLTEEKAHERGYELKIGKFPFRPLGKAMAIGESEGMVKLIFDAKYGELLGAHILGSEATELIAELVLAKTLESTGHEIIKTIHAHPTLGEAVMEAAGVAYGEAINI